LRKTADSGRRQEAEVLANLENYCVNRETAWRLLIFLTLVFCCAADVGAQAKGAGESTRVAVENAAATSRRQLESALKSKDMNLRFPAMRAARYLNEPWIAEIALPLCNAPDFIERVLALEVVANTDPRLGREVFLNALTSGERALRLRGLLGLAALRDTDTIPHLVEIMKNDHDPDLRVTAARALGDVGSLKASIALYEGIESRYAPMREQAVLTLIALSDEGLGEYLIDRLVNDHYPGRDEVLRLLALVPDRSLVSAIEPYLTHEDEVTRVLAAAAILSILDESPPTLP
jgi:HEAT repeat protein